MSEFNFPCKGSYKKNSRYHWSAYVFSIALTVCSCLYIIMYRIVTQPGAFFPNMTANERLILKELSRSVMMEKGTGCQMPEIDPFSNESMQFMKKYPKINCNGFDWIDCYYDECYVLDHPKLKDLDVECTYRPLIYLSDDGYVLDEPVVLKRNQRFKLVRSDHIKVSCIGKKRSGLDLIPVRWYGYKYGLRPIANKTGSQIKHLPNILIFVFDSASRAGFIRHMPKSYQVLNELEFVMMNSYNILGDGTVAAMFPILSGKLSYEFPDLRKYGKSNSAFFNNSYFIFDELRKLGYRTAYFEDMPWIGTFQFRYKGFGSQPTDDYLYPLLMAEFKNGRKWSRGLSEKHCIGATPVHSMMINLTHQFMRLPGKKFDLTFVSGISHDDFNMISSADDEFANFLLDLQKDGLFDNSLVVVMGDHGVRFSEYRTTFQGKIEERLPLMAIRLPSKFKKEKSEQYDNLVSNTKVLTTAFDINAMLLDLLELKHLKRDFKIGESDLNRAISLLDRIPESRSCGEAGIPPHFCACTKWRDVPESDPLYKRVPQVLLKFINTFPIEITGLCMKRFIIETNKVQRFSPNKKMLRFRKSYDMDGLFPDLDKEETGKAAIEHYQATITVSPHRAMFEGTVTYNTSTDTIHVDDKDISRLDSYDREAGCLATEFKSYIKYCYCYSLFSDGE